MGGRGAEYDKGKLIDHLKGEGIGKGTPVPMDIEQFKGMSLQQIEARIRTLKHEELFVLDKGGNVVAAYKGDSNSVAFPENLRYEKGATVTHGHPKSAAEFGGTFSFADMKNMLTSKWTEHRATASGQGEMNYILKRTGRANAKGFYDQINRDYTKLVSGLSKTYDKAYNTAKTKGANTKAAMHVARQSAVGTLNQYYKKTAGKFGFNYVTRKEAYEYGR